MRNLFIIRNYHIIMRNLHRQYAQGHILTLQRQWFRVGCFYGIYDHIASN
jgi:hypothetical protein